ncbi:MAG: TIGR00159 family protein [Deltaproteobacteria bacterium CG2_30_63_29]|nr:MAG: TIGR00159 family protein [Deltaproteobacteria bacterium CG2_30_63_29]PIW02719.1 MAG: TIGR00159 family protein [Deltaproteobacteria bacterium CG17_big_fil_post_rev_8_21_14_2_50_63_7]PJB36394.1 MAG: TIGR00159 family protein [Deltaproteobacteria bacterium CG_4_9_14_3_um_filter_63_12]
MLDQFVNIFSQASTKGILIGVVDILLVYYVLYRILLLIKGTKAVQILVGLLLVVVLYFASEQEYFDLQTLNWLLDKFIASFVVILVIIFQEDIRRGLSQVGLSSRFTGLSRIAEAHFLEEIVKAAAILSERRLGALIVIKREASLDDYEGIRIDAEVSKELLVSLFIPFKQSPTHDGAVVVANGRIAAAGCFLPLTTNARIDRSLGTRHRAALGMSETTDAVILVVSEETGIISVAFKEELTRRLSTDELRDLLQKLFSEKEMQRQAMKQPGFLLRRLRVPRKRKKHAPTGS